MPPEESIEFAPVNRAAVSLRARQPFVDWVMALPDLAPGEVHSLATVNEDPDVLLVPEFETKDEIVGYVAAISPALFEQWLEDYCGNEAWWPQDRTLEMFWAWFEVTVHTLVVDSDPSEELGHLE